MSVAESALDTTASQVSETARLMIEAQRRETAAAFGVAPGYVEHYARTGNIITHDMAAGIQAELDRHNAQTAERAARLSGAAAGATVAHEALQVDPTATSLGNVATTLASMGTITEPSSEVIQSAPVLTLVPEGMGHLNGTGDILDAQLPSQPVSPSVADMAARSLDLVAASS